MAAAYVLVQLGPHATEADLEAIRGISGVKQAHLVMGPTDVIAYVEASDIESLGETLISLRKVEGVASTDSRLALDM